MDSVRGALEQSVTFESLFDEHSPAISKELFRDTVIQGIRATGQMAEIDVTGESPSGIIIKNIDPHVSQGYNVFESDGDYQTWVQQSMHDPSEEEIMEALKNNGTGS